jgi:hypothetical protein
MGFLDRLMKGLFPINHEQLRRAFPHGELEVVGLYTAQGLTDGVLTNGHLIQLANGDGGFFRMSDAQLDVVVAHNGLHIRWRKGWGLVSSPRKIDMQREFNQNRHPWVEKPSISQPVFQFHNPLGDSYGPPSIKFDEAWSFWRFSFFANVNNPSGATVFDADLAIRGKGTQLETLLGGIPVG